MKFSNDVKKHILYVTGTSLILTSLMLAVFVLVGHFSLPVLWGALCGCFLSCLNFFLLAVTLGKAVDNQKRGKAIAGVSYTARSLMMLLGGVLAIVWLRVNPVALIIPYIFPRVSVSIIQAIQARKNQADEGSAPNGS